MQTRLLEAQKAFDYFLRPAEGIEPDQEFQGCTKPRTLADRDLDLKVTLRLTVPGKRQAIQEEVRRLYDIVAWETEEEDTDTVQQVQAIQVKRSSFFHATADLPTLLKQAVIAQSALEGLAAKGETVLFQQFRSCTARVEKGRLNRNTRIILLLPHGVPHRVDGLDTRPPLHQVLKWGPVLLERRRSFGDRDHMYRLVRSWH